MFLYRALHVNLPRRPPSCPTEKRAKAFLQQQAADMRSGGQGGMWKKKQK